MEHNFIIKNFTDERAYHNTAILIYLKAFRDVLGSVDIRIANSLNQGYFTYAHLDRPLSSTDIHKIWNRMEDIISQDTEIKVEQVRSADAARMWRASGYKEKGELFEQRDPDEMVEVVNLDGYRNFMYCTVLPSTGYINLFELRTYRNGLLLRLPNALNPDSIPPYRDDDKLYDAFAETKRLRKQTGLDYLSDINRQIREGNTEGLIRGSEWLQKKQIENYADMIARHGCRVVLIAGPSSSGKTTTAKRLCAAISERIGEPLYLGTDDYFVERNENPIGADGKPDYECLEAIDLNLFRSQMANLIHGQEVDIPEFDFINGTKVFGKRITRLGKNQILVIEGIHSLNDTLTENIDRKDKFKLYISPLTLLSIDRHNRISTADARLLRRIVRDNQFRGYDAEATIEMWPKVRAGESVNVFPYSSSADAVFNSSTVYETNLLKTYAEPLLEAITEDSKQYAEAQRILTFMKYFDKISEEDAEVIPDNAIIREFIGPRK